jgi:hypothetical protein
MSFKRQSHPQGSMPRRTMMQASSAKASEGVFTRARPAGATRGFSDHTPPVKGRWYERVCEIWHYVHPAHDNADILGWQQDWPADEL